MSIEISGIFKSFGAKTVLRGASLFVPDGSAACLGGANGCGKTTLLKILSTLSLADAGEVLVNGVSAESFPIAARAQMAFVASGEGGFYESLSLQNNLLFFGRMRNVRDTLLKGRIKELAKRFGIVEWLGEAVSHCSSGIRRKAAILRSALYKPSVYLIDEFSESLDDNSREAVCAFFREEMARGCACLIVSNHSIDAKMLNASMCRLNDGEIKPA